MSAYQNQPPQLAFAALQDSPDAVLIDCRTRAEWVYVGVPVLPEGGAKTAFIEWVDMAGRPNPDFAAQVREVAGPQTPIYLLCRSAVRSEMACQFLAKSGFETLVNITEGFEGDLGPTGQRACINGWKFRDLPWAQH
ncbi:MAG: rhodanese-like domain-containing protein [Candidatus Puniceispirillaceae bacterium]